MSGPIVRFAVANDLDLGAKQLINTSWLFDGRTAYNKGDMALVMNGTSLELWAYNGDTRLAGISQAFDPRDAPTTLASGDWIQVSGGGGTDIAVTGSGDNVVGTTVVAGNLTGVALGTITSGGTITAAAVEALFDDGSGDRAVSYSVNAEGEIETTVSEDTSKQDSLSASQLAVTNADPFTSGNYTPTSISVIDSDVGLNGSNEVTSIRVGSSVRNIYTGADVDTALGVRIDEEKLAREGADTALQNNIDAEAVTRAEDDALEAFTREAGDDAERDYVNTTLHVDAADSQSYYQFSGQPAIFTEDAGVDYGITIAMPETIEDTESLVQAENIGQTTKVFKLRLRFNDGANDTKEYVVTTGGYSFTISDERSSETFTLPTIEGTYSAASVHQNGTNTQRQNCFLAIGGWFGRIAQIDMAHVLDVSNGNILTGRTLEVAQDYSEHVIADNNDTAVVGMVFDNQTTGSHTGINAYVLQRRNRIVRYRAATSGGLFSFRNGNSVVDRFHPSRVPDVVSQQTVDESNWLGLKLVTIQNAISNTSASGQSNRLTFAVGDKMLVAVGEAVDSASAGISIPGIAISKNPSTFAGGSVNLGLFYPGGNDPSEEYSNYVGSGANSNEADFDATIFDMEYSNASGAWTFFFGGETVGATTVETRAAGFHGTSIWNMATVSAATKVGAGGIIRSIALGGNIAGLASDTNFWLTTELGALYVTKTPWLGAGYSDSTLLQARTNPNDPTSDVKRDFTFRGFQYFDQHGSIGAADDGHIYRLVINPEVTFTVTFGNVTHTATYRFNDDTAAMHTYFGTPSNWTPTLVNTGVNLTTLAPGSEPADQLYLDFSVNGQNTPVVSYQWVGVLATTDDDFETYNPFRRLLLENTAVDIHYPDGGATYHAVLSSNANDYTAGNETNEAVDQIVAVVNQHTAQGHSAVRVDGQFADTITNTKPVLRLDQAGTHALQNAPTVTVVHPEEQASGTLAVVRFADGGYDTIGRPGGLFDPNDYDTRAEADAKLAAIASTHGYAENIVANAGSGDTTYTRLDRLQVGTEIYSTSTRLGELNDAGQFVTLEELTNQTVTFVAGGNITLSGGEITITADSTYRILATWGDEYTGTITFPAAAASNVAGTLVIDTTALGIVYAPPFPVTGFSVTGNSDIQEELGVPTYVGVSGDVRLEGSGVSRNGQVFTFSDATKADTSSTVIDTDVILNSSNQITGISIAGTTRNFVPGESQDFSDWAVNTAYTVGNIVLTSIGTLQFLWRCEVAHTSDNTAGGAGDGEPRFNVLNTNWSQIGPVPVVQWITGFNYSIGDTVLYTDTTTPTNSGVFQRLIGGSDASSSDNPAANTSDWVRLNGNDTALRDTPDDVADDAAWDSYIGGGNLGFTKTIIDYGQNITPSAVGSWTPSLIASIGDNRLTVSNVPTNITLDDNARYVIQVGTAAEYNGTISITGSDISVQDTGLGFGRVWEIFTAAADASAVPAVPDGTFNSLAGNIITVTTNIFSGESVQIAGDVVITGDGIVYNSELNAFVIAGATGNIPDPFKYALLLSNGFLLPENAAMSTATRDAYTDVAGVYGTPNTVYWFDNANDSWYNVATGGIALVSFP